MPDLVLWAWLFLLFLVLLIVGGGAWLGRGVRALYPERYEAEEEWRGCLSILAWQPGAPTGCLGCLPILVPVFAVVVPVLLGLLLLSFECVVLILLIIGMFLLAAAVVAVLITGWLILPPWPVSWAFLVWRGWPWNWPLWQAGWWPWRWPWRWPLFSWVGPPGCLAAPFASWPLGALVGTFWLIGINVLVWAIFLLCLTDAIAVSGEGEGSLVTVERGAVVAPLATATPSPTPLPTATPTVEPAATIEPTATPEPTQQPTPTNTPQPPAPPSPTPSVAPTPTVVGDEEPAPILYQDPLNDVTRITDANQAVEQNVANHPADIGLVEIRWMASETHICLNRPNKTQQSNSSAGLLNAGPVMGQWQLHDEVLMQEIRAGGAPAPGARIQADAIGRRICFIIPDALLSGVASIRVASFDRPNAGDLRGFDDTPPIPLSVGGTVPE
jgi:hypothetical protein